jgi:small subunit ribosomal protein S17
MKKSIGINVNPPERKCEDPKCAWHGKLPVRGRIFSGIVKSSKSHNTAIVEWGYHKMIPKYESYERRKTRVTAHNPSCIHAREGDTVTIAECRSLSKTKHFVVVSKTAATVKGDEKGNEKQESSESPKEAKV